MPPAGHSRYAVPISYTARSREDGKGLTWRDGVEPLWILLRLGARPGTGPARSRRR